MKKEGRHLMKGKFIILLIILINISFVSSWVGTDTKYYAQGEGCRVNTNLAEWIFTTITPTIDIQTLEVVFNLSGNVGNCSRYTNATNTTCCPSGYSCIDSKCIQEINDPCEDFETLRECENSNIISSGENPAERYFKIVNQTIYNSKCNSIGSGEYLTSSNLYCNNFSSCLCYWNTTNKECNTRWQDYRLCEDGSIEILGSCDYEVLKTESLCDTLGKIIVTYKVSASPTNLPDCSPPQPREVSCSAVVVVPFFTATNFIISLLVITGTYFIIIRKNIKV